MKMNEPRFFQKKVDITPGPGTYRTKKDFVDDVQKTVILSTKEPRIAKKKIENTPGPGEYQENIKFVRNNSPSI